MPGEDVMNEFPSVEQLMELASKDPAALEQLRQNHVRALIDGAPQHMQRRLRGLQFQIDCQRRLHGGSPMGSCVAIARMMIESLHSLNDALHGEIAPDRGHNRKPSNTSAVVPFPASASS